MKTILTPIAMLCTLLSPFTFSDETTSAPNLDTYDILIDLSNPTSGDQIITKKGRLKIKIINMVPSQRADYVIQTHQIIHVVPSLTQPQTTPVALPAGPSLLPPGVGFVGAIPCPLDGLRDELKRSTKSSEVAELIPKIRAARSALVRGDCSNTINELNYLISQTHTSTTAYIDNEHDAKISVSLGSTLKPLVTMNVRPIRSEWISSYGFGFVDSLDKNYHSVGNDTEGYVIAEQKDRQSLSYSAMVVFTYPFHAVANGMDLGVTGGIGASQDNIAALAGLSLIVNKNFIITGGAIIQEFHVLKGQYSPGDNIGPSPLDSAVLQDKTFKPAAAIVLSYRFAAGGSGAKTD